MDLGVASFFAPLDVSMIIIDCSWNMQAADVARKAPLLIAYLRKNGHSATPIVMVQGTTAGAAWVGNSSGFPTGIVGGINETANRAATKAAFEALAPKDKHLHFVDGNALYHHKKGDSTDKAWLDHDDPTVGGLHPSDLGHYQIAEFYAAMLPPLLATSDARAAAQTAELAAVAAVKAAEAALEPAGVLSAAERELHELQTKLMQHEASADAPPAPKPGYSYTDLRSIGVHGRVWNDTSAGNYYSRLPAAAKKDVTSAVWGLSLDSTDQYVRFTTDAPTLHIPWTPLHACKSFWHMPISGTCYCEAPAPAFAILLTTCVADSAPLISGSLRLRRNREGLAAYRTALPDRNDHLLLAAQEREQRRRHTEPVHQEEHDLPAVPARAQLHRRRLGGGGRAGRQLHSGDAAGGPDARQHGAQGGRGG